MNMAESKTYVFGEGGQGGFDPNILLAGMMSGGGFGGFGGGNWLLPFFLLALWGNNGFGGGFGGGGNGYLANALNNDAGRELLMQGIQGNANAIGQLASQLHCSVGDIQQAINVLSTQLCNVGSKVDMSALQVVNAIQAGNAGLVSQLAQCCCDLKGVMTQGFSSVAYETQRQTCDIEKAIANSTSEILAGQRAAEMREMQEKINTLTEEKQTYKLGNMMAQANAPLAQAISALQSDVDGIKCKLPKTETIVASPEYVPINRGINVNYGLCGYNAYGGCGYGFPFGGNGSLWG